ncbi:CYTH and CHAD domain-containing protein, partial [Psychromonas antarctica]|uniref:CYTH and CHAD domain-containing protein n=1 Tax=Psychromonas antarctica TaxID=67573 RepID=UPI001EE97BF1
NAQHFISNKTQFLHNIYFDTANRTLRKMDIGLRVRSCDNSSLQTIKTAGRVIGGLHQRPEYNEPIEGTRPELSRFNSKIWPDGCDIKALESELIPMFCIDFQRQTWLVEMADNTLIEVAYDKGLIEGNQGKINICEIELELVKGDEKQLFVLGDEIASLPQVRLGNVSKAQRGYMLTDNACFNVKPLLHSPLTSSMSVDQALFTNIQHGLRHIQYHENCYIESFQDDALIELLTGIKFLHQNLKLFKQSSTTLLEAQWIDDLHWLARNLSWLEQRSSYQSLLDNKGYYLRKLPKFKSLLKKLETQNNSLPNRQAVLDLLTSTRYCQFILNITQWLLQFEKNTFASEKINSINDFAYQHLSTNWEELRRALTSENNNQLLSYQGLLEANLLIGLSLGYLFPEEKTSVFRSLWLDIKQGLKECAMINAIEDFADQETDLLRRAEYLKWIKRKEESLLHALEQSKNQALLREVYWLREID